MEVEEEKMEAISSTGTPGVGTHTFPEAIPVPAPLFLPVHVPPSPQSSVQPPQPEYSFGRNCEQYQAPVADRTQNDKLTWEQIHEQCSQRGYH